MRLTECVACISDTFLCAIPEEAKAGQMGYVVNIVLPTGGFGGSNPSCTTTRERGKETTFSKSVIGTLQSFDTS